MSIPSRRRRLAVVIGVAAAILIPAVQQIGGLGISQASFSAQGDSTLRAPGYAFAIWTVIYLAIGAYAIYQTRARDTRALRALAWPAAIATAGCGAWIIAAAANWMWPTIAVILASAAAAITGLLRAAPEAFGKDRWLALVPMALLGGWLTIASALNILMVLTAKGVITPEAAPLWAMGAIAVVAGVACAVALRAKSWAYPLPIAWGLSAVYVAERAEKPGVAMVAAVAAGVMLLLAAAAGLRARRR
jgi:hypothetical protein